MARSLIPRQIHRVFDSITSPTRARIDDDTMSPSVLAILRLTTSSEKLVDSRTGSRQALCPSGFCQYKTILVAPIGGHSDWVKNANVGVAALGWDLLQASPPGCFARLTKACFFPGCEIPQVFLSNPRVFSNLIWS